MAPPEPEDRLTEVALQLTPRPHRYEFRQVLPHDVGTVFAWHRRPGAIVRLMPPWQPVRVVGEAADLADGEAVIALPAGRRWVARHLADEYRPEGRFVDEIANRPFGMPMVWRHEHEFVTEPGGTAVIDTVTTNLPRRSLEAMFAYRHRQLTDDLAAHATGADTPRLTIAITGASGLVGSALAAFLSTGGHDVIRLVRREPSAPGERRWDPEMVDPRVFEGVDALVHLAGHGIAGRFTDAHRARVRDSRVEPTRRLAEAAALAGVRVMVSASAIGVYGADRADELLTEVSPPGDDFLAGVVVDWEEAALANASATLRVVAIRTGIVQSPRGGALRPLRLLWSTGLGGRIGSGQQWQAWIGIDDVVDIYHRALIDPRLEGVVNAVAPHPVRQREYAAALGRALHRPAKVPVPSFGPQLLLGREGARELALANQRVVPARLLHLGHRFRFPDIDRALEHLLGRNRVGAVEPGTLPDSDKCGERHR